MKFGERIGKVKTRESTSDGVSSDAPPPYSAISSIQPPRAPRKPRTRLEQLQRYLIEIVAYSLDVDLATLVLAFESQATCSEKQTGGRMDSILDDYEKEDLLKLAETVETLLRQHKEKNWALARDCDRQLVMKSVVEPARQLKPAINVGYLLDMIAGYAK